MREVRGAPTHPWTVRCAVQTDRRRAVFDVVTPHPTSIAFATPGSTTSPGSRMRCPDCGGPQTASLREFLTVVSQAARSSRTSPPTEPICAPPKRPDRRAGPGRGNAAGTPRVLVCQCPAERLRERHLGACQPRRDAAGPEDIRRCFDIGRSMECQSIAPVRGIRVTLPRPAIGGVAASCQGRGRHERDGRAIPGQSGRIHMRAVARKVHEDYERLSQAGIPDRT